MGRRLVALLALVFVGLAGCANIPDQSTPQAVGDLSDPSPGAARVPDAKADPPALVRAFVDAADNPDAAKGYLTDAAKPNWQGAAPPTIIAEKFDTFPVQQQERKAPGDDNGGNDRTVVLTVTLQGRLGPDRAFVPAIGSAEYRVAVHRNSADAPWRIQTPPEIPLITLPKFKTAYRPVSVYYFDPEFRVAVPDVRYIAAQPAAGAPDRVLRLLLVGPSATLDNAVKTAIPPETEMGSNAVSDADGALVVNLSKLGDRSQQERMSIATQVVLSLKDITQTKIRLLADGHPLISGRSPDWHLSDLPAYDRDTRPGLDLPGMFTAPSGRVYSLRDGAQIQWPAGSADLKVISAAQSVDGKGLAVVQEVPTGARLRIGGIGTPLRDVDLVASTLTRPTWLIAATPGSTSNEVWTVQNGVDLVRVIRTGNDTWTPSPVIATELQRFEGTITDLRLSRDGIRIAAVIGGRLVVASVVRTKDTVSIRSPRFVRPGELLTVVGVDWLSQDTLVVATGQSSQPVLSVPVDGFDPSPYSSANLGAAITAIAAAPDRSVLVTDSRGMWEAIDTHQIWQLHPTQIPGARPFYPG
jgi:hypothetical protein